MQGEILAKFPNFGLYSKLSPNDLCQADFLGLAQMAQFSNLCQSKIGNILQNFQFWTDSKSWMQKEPNMTLLADPAVCSFSFRYRTICICHHTAAGLFPEIKQEWWPERPFFPEKERLHTVCPYQNLFFITSILITVKSWTLICVTNQETNFMLKGHSFSLS